MGAIWTGKRTCLTAGFLACGLWSLILALFRQCQGAVLLASAGLCLIAPGSAFAQSSVPEQTQAVTVGVYVSPPFVMSSEGDYHGMAIDLWEAVAGQLGLATRYKAYPTIRALVNATESNEIDAVVTNLTITRDRAERVSFTHPWYDAGLRILVRNDGNASFWGVISGLSNAGHLRAYAGLLFVIVVGTIALTLFDRKLDPDFPKRWREGIAESFYHVMSIATAGRTAHKNLFGWVGRIWQGIWMLIGIAVIAYVTASVTSVMTALSIEQGINSLADLHGKTVGVFTGSVSEDYVTKLRIASRSYADIDQAVAAMKAGQIDAIVGDAPILEHYAITHSGDDVTAVGRIFHPDKYGFAFPLGSDLRIPTTLQILELHEDGSIEKLRSNYFGAALRPGDADQAGNS